MDSTKKSVSGLATASLILGITAFIPLLGVLLGIIAIILGIISINNIKKHGLKGKNSAIVGIVLGALGIILTFSIYGYLFHMLKSKTGPAAEMKNRLTEKVLVHNQAMLELYKQKEGAYPEDLETAINKEYTIFLGDAYENAIFYKISSDKISYELKSLGADGQLGTNDDIFPADQVDTTNAID